MARYDIAQYAYYAVFLVVAIFCYGWEIWERTPWLLVQERLTKIMNGLARRKAYQNQKTSATLAKACQPRRPSTVNSERPGQQDAAIPDTLEDGGRPSKLGKSGSLITEWFIPPLRWMTILPGILWLPTIVLALLQLYHREHDDTLLMKSTSEWNTSVLCEELLRVANATDLCDDSLPTRVNADIGGEGIRAGVYMPVGLALLALIQGSFHTADSGIKEIGTTQLLTLFYLNFNAAKAAATTPSFSDLTFPEAVIVCMCIDLTAAGLHMTTSGKESLAARWFIYMADVMQLWAIAMMIAMLAHIRDNYTDLPAVSIIWWGRISSRTGPSKPVWIYITSRCCIFAHGLWLDCCHTKDFHVIEKQWSSLLASGDQDAEKQKGIKSKFDYGTLRAAVFSKWIEYLPSILVASASIETLVKRQLKSKSDITEWGQSAALVIAIAGTLHWIFVIVNVRIEARQSARQSAQQRSSAVEFSKRVLSDGPPQEEEVSRRPVNYPKYASAWDPLRRASNKDLIKAAKEFDKGAIRHALEHGAKVDYLDPHTDMTVLLYVIERDNLSFFKELVFVRNASTDAAPTSALSFAAQKGAMEILTYLLETDLVALTSSDLEGRTAVWYAAYHKQIGALDALLAKVNNLHFGISTHDCQETGVKLPFGMSIAMTRAAEVQCKTLISSAEIPPHKTPLFVAAEQEFSEIAQRLLDSPAQLDSLPSVREILQAAAERKNVPALKCLLGCVSDALRLDENNSSFLHLAVTEENSKLDLDFLIEFFRESAPDLSVRDELGRTPLFMAVAFHRHGAIKTLMRHGADPFCKASDGRSPFTLMAEGPQPPLPPYHSGPDEPACRYPICAALFPEGYDPARGFDNSLSEELALKLMDLPLNELEWLARRGFVGPIDRVGKNEKFLILYALDHAGESALLALTASTKSVWRGFWVALYTWQAATDQHERDKLTEVWGYKDVFAKLGTKLAQMSPDDRKRCLENIRRGGHVLSHT